MGVVGRIRDLFRVMTPRSYGLLDVSYLSVWFVYTYLSVRFVYSCSSHSFTIATVTQLSQRETTMILKRTKIKICERA